MTDPVTTPPHQPVLVPLPLQELHVDCSTLAPAAAWAGVRAVLRPLGCRDLAAWLDSFTDVAPGHLSAYALVQRQLLRIDGLVIGSSIAAAVPFDASNPEHFPAVFHPLRGGLPAVSGLWHALAAGAGLAPRHAPAPSPSPAIGNPPPVNP